MRRSAQIMVQLCSEVLLVLLLITLASVLADQVPCDHRVKLSNCRNNELKYEIEMDGPYGDKFIVEQKVRRVPNERTLASMLGSQRTPLRDWVGSVFPTWRPGPLRQFMNGGRQRSSRTAVARTNRQARANRRGRAGARRITRRNQRI